MNLPYRPDESLFNLRRLKAQTKVSHDSLTELQYANTRAFVTHSPEDLQTSLYFLMGVYSELKLVINAGETEILHFLYDTPSYEISEILLGDVPLKVTNNFIYLGAILSSDCSLTRNCAAG